MIETIDHPLKAEAPLDAGRIREFKLARPPVNALNAELMRALIAAVEAAAKEAAQQKETAAQMKAAHAEGLDTFQRAFGACMDARGYSVK